MHCYKCSSRKNLSRHHIYGKYGLCGLKTESDLPLRVFLTWTRTIHDDVSVMFWATPIIHLCRECHDEFHILFSALINKCKQSNSDRPLEKYLEENKCALTNGIEM